MAINLGGGFQPTNNTPQQNSGERMVSLNLAKNDILDLTKRNPGLTMIKLGAGWDVANGGNDFDLDIVALLLDKNNRFQTVSNIVFFNNKTAPGVTLNGDNRTGAGDGDDETMIIDLSQVDSNIHRIVVGISIFNAKERRQTFGMVNNSYIRLVDIANNDNELCRFDLKTDGSTATSVIFAELNRDGSEWQFKTIGEGRIADLNELASMYQ